MSFLISATVVKESKVGEVVSEGEGGNCLDKMLCFVPSVELQKKIRICFPINT